MLLEYMLTYQDDSLSFNGTTMLIGASGIKSNKEKKKFFFNLYFSPIVRLTSLKIVSWVKADPMLAYTEFVLH